MLECLACGTTIGNESGLAAVGGLDDPVRRRLYAYVPAAPSRWQGEAAAAVGIGRPLAAYHLDKLVDLGLLTASYRRPPGERAGSRARPRSTPVGPRVLGERAAQGVRARRPAARPGGGADPSGAARAELTGQPASSAPIWAGAAGPRRQGAE